MTGFGWVDPGSTRPDLPGDTRCLRDVIGELFRWSEGGEDWGQFISGPSPADTFRLFDHLGLRVFDPGIPQHVAELAYFLDHPGLSVHALHRAEISHTIFRPRVVHPHHLPDRYAAFEPELVCVIVDPCQPPRDGYRPHDLPIS